ncbi:ATP-grasp domain-containing protein [Nesterenkonia alkaliphila]|nr:ATP-grasp domain-containing protein [Nesterenkonia alkaliphila]GFZ89495.1 hypothetical protein GCM10011359_18630 [Nesterenkonia alkaliphila]
MGFSKAGSVINSRPAAPLTQDKHSTRLILQDQDVPVPKGMRFTPQDLEAAVDYASEELGYPVVVKPLHGTQGKGVLTGIGDESELRWAFGELSGDTAQDEIVVEEQIEGEAYRIIVVNGRAVSALISRRCAVTGNGSQTVRQLVEERQQVRRGNPHLMSRPIHVDERLEHLLQRQHTALDSVLEAGRTVHVTYGSNTSQGGEPEQVLEKLHPSILEASARAVEAIPGLGFAGVDFIIPAPDRPLTEQRAGICEINSVPAVDSHEYPLYGAPVTVAQELVRTSAEHAGVSLSSYRTTVALKVTIDCPGARKEFKDWLAARAEQMGLKVSFRLLSLRTVHGKVNGPAEEAAAWLAHAFQNPHQVTPRSLEVHHV